MPRSHGRPSNNTRSSQRKLLLNFTRAGSYFRSSVCLYDTHQGSSGMPGGGAGMSAGQGFGAGHGMPVGCGVGVTPSGPRGGGESVAAISEGSNSELFLGSYPTIAPYAATNA